jgi:hypothetical protein
VLVVEGAIFPAKLLAPAKVYAPVVTTPLALALALGTATAELVPPVVVIFKVGPAVVPPVQVTEGVVKLP